MPQRPVSILVLAILGILIGLAWTCCSFIGSVSPVAATGMAQMKGEKTTLGETVTWQFALLWARYVFELAVAVFVLVASIGLLRMRPWGRRLGLAAAGLLFLSVAVGVPLCLWEYMLNRDQLPAVPATPPPPGVMEATMVVTYGGILIAYLLWFAYGVALIVVLRKPAIKQCFNR